MYHFFVNKENITGETVRIEGEDYFHAVNVLRLNIGETIIISDEDGVDYLCQVSDIDKDGPKNDRSLFAKILEVCKDNHELPAEVWLFQGLPKSDKMELIIQKATELGATHIVPVQTKNAVAKIEDKKISSKTSRWQEIAKAAAKQSKRSRIPLVHEPLRLKEAMELADELDVKLIPYEDEHGLTGLCESIINFLPGTKIGVFIGPEGGFDPMEVSMANRHGFRSVSLGKRILRTETAAIAMLSLVMIRLEIAANIDLSEG